MTGTWPRVGAEAPVKGTVLIVDDSPDNLGFLLEYFVAVDYRVLVALSGEEALRRLDKTTPDVILLDAIMPGLDGFETCARIKADPSLREIPVIFMSALTEPADKVKAFRHGAVDYITKPVNKDEVLARVDAQVSLMRLRAQLVRRNEELEAFGHMLAHDLRGPLAAILAQTEVMADDLRGLRESGAVSEDLLDDLVNVRIAAQGMNETIDAMLLLAGVVGTDLSLEVVRMSTIIDDALSRVASLSRRVKAEVEVEADLPIVIGYAPWLEQVWCNLIGNGLKYGGTPPVLALGASPRSDSMVEFWIRDNGPGIPEASLRRVFEPFTRLSPDREGGYGIGLSIVERIVTKLGGEVGARRLSRGGSEFFFTLRCAG